VGDGLFCGGCNGVDLYSDGLVWVIWDFQPTIPNPNDFDFSLSINFIPEPSTASLLALGLVGIAMRRRRSGRSLYT
jgi:hypothetical protein